ncbi:MAG: HAMP domain-containing histidine kinase [Chloroflexota bacterium]
MAGDKSSSINTPLAPENLVPLLGDHLVRKNLLSSEDLQKGLAFQKKTNTSGSQILLGEALVQLKLIDQTALNQAITEQILMLQSALHKSNQHLENSVVERTKDLEIAMTKLTEFNDLKTQFVSNVSHELRTPLSHMVGYLDLLQKQNLGPLTKEQENAVSVLKKSYDRLSGLIDNLIQFSVITKGDLSLDTEPLSANQLIKEIVSNMQEQAAKKEIKISYKPPKEVLNINADKEKFSWVMTELINNAIKFNQSKGTVLVKTWVENKLIYFSIIDNGIGIESQKMEEIFEPFHQLDGSSTRKYGGTGIGLSLVKQILEAHDTRLIVKSKLGAGSAFGFSIPRV